MNGRVNCDENNAKKDQRRPLLQSATNGRDFDNGDEDDDSYEEQEISIQFQQLDQQQRQMWYNDLILKSETVVLNQEPHPYQQHQLMNNGNDFNRLPSSAAANQLAQSFVSRIQRDAAELAAEIEVNKGRSAHTLGHHYF